MNKVLLFTGAGASVELGVPAMRQMAVQFRNHLHDLALPINVIEKIDSLVGQDANDMEYAIDVIDRLEGGYKARVELGETVNDSEISPYRTIKEEAEWFVQHCCEQIRVNAAVRMWSSSLKAATDIELCIASTNYDRAIEITASRMKLKLADGFEDFSGEEVANWRGFGGDNSIRLLKLHGSTDWYRGPNDEVFKLRHPMPLYGRLKLIPEEIFDGALQSALILPSREKIVTLPPFPSLAAEFRRQAEEAELAIFVGSSLRDPHMRDVCISCAKSKPTYVVSRSGAYPNGVLPDGVTVLRQSSGHFFLSTLPEFLKAQDERVLQEETEIDRSGSSDCLSWLTVATDENESVDQRCLAIENLAEKRVPLQKDAVEEALRSPVNEVRLFALGLIPASKDKAALITIAHEISEKDTNAAFKGELELLSKMVNASQGDRLETEN